MGQIGRDRSAYRAQKPRHGRPMAGVCHDRTNYRPLAFAFELTDGASVVSRADEYRLRAKQCLDMAGAFREREARVALAHSGPSKTD